MAAPWAAGAEVRIVGQIHGQTTNNVLHFATNTQINDPIQRDALILALLTAMLACVTEQLVTGVTSDWTLDHLEGRSLFPTVGDPIIKPPDAPTQGQLSPASVSFASSLISIKTGLGGRKGRGRIFLPPPGEGETTGSVSAQSVFTELQAFINCVVGKFIGQSASEQWRLGVLSRKDLAGSVNNFNTAFREATTLVPQRTLAVMSRRRIGRGV
jgi:hypothetical protein